MVRLDRIHHTGYFTDDLEAAVRRYTETFPGDRVIRGESTVFPAKIAFVRSGDTWVEIMEPADKSVLGGQTGLILHHIAYEVADIDQAVRELSARGVRFRPGVPTPGPAGPIAYLEDGQLGSALHLIQPNEEFRLPAR